MQDWLPGALLDSALDEATVQLEKLPCAREGDVKLLSRVEKWADWHRLDVRTFMKPSMMIRDGRPITDLYSIKHVISMYV